MASFGASTERDAADPIIRVLAAVILRQGRWLLCLRPEHKRHGGSWEFPGGKLEAGESLHDAAVRELMEELGVAVTGTGDVLYAIRDEGSPFLIQFAEVGIEGEAEPLEHDDVRWVAPADALLLPLAPADRAFVDEYLRRLC